MLAVMQTFTPRFWLTLSSSCGPLSWVASHLFSRVSLQCVTHYSLLSKSLALTLRAFYKRRLEFSQFLSTHSSLSMSRYIRLMMLAISEMICTIPISIYSFYISSAGVPLQPWISWADTHYGFSYVGQIPAAEWMGDPNYRIAVELTRWLFPASALWFFLLFGFGTEARKNYRIAFLRAARFFGYKPASEAPLMTPQYVIRISFFRVPKLSPR